MIYLAQLDKDICASWTKVQGLGLLVRPSGAKTYIYYRRLPDNNESPRKICELTIGRYVDVTIEQARKRATEMNHAAGLGKDPSKTMPQSPTYGYLFARYIEDYASLHNSTWREAEKNFKRYFSTFASISTSSISCGSGGAASSGIHKGNNPCVVVSTSKTLARERFLQPGDEYKRFAEALVDEPNESLRDFLWMCLFTGARCSNVLSML